WDRALHASLIERLTADGAKAIVFDILFTEASTNAVADQKLAEAIRKSGRVILSGKLKQDQAAPEAAGSGEEIPFAPFLEGAAGWGNANFSADQDYGIRVFFPNLKDFAG